MRAEGSTALACKWKRKRPVTGVNGAAQLVIVDDHALIRAGLREVLAGVPFIKVIGEASNGREALELCSRVRPELVLMDVRMPEMDWNSPGRTDTFTLRCASFSHSILFEVCRASVAE